MRRIQRLSGYPSKVPRKLRQALKLRIKTRLFIAIAEGMGYSIAILFTYGI